jgi:hypothetical protein
MYTRFGGRPPGTDDSAVSQRSSTLRAYRWSPRVRPRLKAEIGMLLRAAALGEAEARKDHKRRAHDVAAGKLPTHPIEAYFPLNLRAQRVGLFGERDLSMCNLYSKNAEAIRPLFQSDTRTTTARGLSRAAAGV